MNQIRDAAAVLAKQVSNGIPLSKWQVHHFEKFYHHFTHHVHTHHE
jgi:hypothetical protein